MRWLGQRRPVRRQLLGTCNCRRVEHFLPYCWVGILCARFTTNPFVEKQCSSLADMHGVRGRRDNTMILRTACPFKLQASIPEFHGSSNENYRHCVGSYDNQNSYKTSIYTPQVSSLHSAVSSTVLRLHFPEMPLRCKSTEVHHYHHPSCQIRPSSSLFLAGSPRLLHLPTTADQNHPYRRPVQDLLYPIPALSRATEDTTIVETHMGVFAQCSRIIHGHHPVTREHIC